MPSDLIVLTASNGENLKLAERFVQAAAAQNASAELIDLTQAGKPVLNQDLWKALDAARLDDVPLRYVKGHSGDPDNERVDRIAVAFSQGRAPDLASGSTQPEPASQPTFEPAPQPLLELLSRLELADRLAQGGYALSLVELAQLVEQPLKQLETRTEPWFWRDWSVVPQREGRWTLQRREAGSGQS